MSDEDDLRVDEHVTLALALALALILKDQVAFEQRRRAV